MIVIDNAVEAYGLREIKEAVLNPLKIFENIIGIELPDDRMPYTSTLMQTLAPLFDSMFEYELFDYRINDILEKHDINVGELNKIIRGSNNKLTMFLQLFSYIENDIQECHREICLSLTKVSNAQLIKESLNKLLENIFIDEYTIFEECKENTLRQNPNNLTLAVELFSRMTKNILDALMHPEHYEEELEMRKLRKAATQTEWTKDPDSGDIEFDVIKKDKVKIEDNRKKKTEELRGHVNKLDKDSGVKLKHPKDTVDDEYDYVVKLENYKTVLARLLFILNDVDETNYINYDNIFGCELRKIKINSEFKDESGWFDDAQYGIDEIIFKVRFLSYVITWVMKNLGKLADKCYEVNKDGDFIEWEIKLEYVEYTVERLGNLIAKMLHGISYDDDLVYFMEIQFYLEMDSDNAKKSLKKIKNIHDQTDALSLRLKPFAGSEDMISMDTLLKLSYLVSTYDTSAKGVVDIRDGYRFKDNKLTKEMVEELGQSIIDSRDEYDTPKLFKFFVKSEPLVFSRWRDVNSNQALVVGILALDFYAFIVNDKNIKRRVTRLLEA